jgi:hypothetical protein
VIHPKEPTNLGAHDQGDARGEHREDLGELDRDDAAADDREGPVVQCNAMRCNSMQCNAMQ